MNTNTLKEVDKEKMQSFEENLRDYFKNKYTDVWTEVNSSEDWNDDFEKKYKKILDGFMKEGSFNGSN